MSDVGAGSPGTFGAAPPGTFGAVPPGTFGAVARRFPKVELHCHLEGSARPGTIIELARANEVRLPVDDPRELFRFNDLNHFLEIYGVVCASICTPDDVRRITYEALEDAVAAGVRYREMFFAPAFLMSSGMTLPQVWAGIRAGLADAHADLDVKCRMILDLDKPGDPALHPEWVRFAAEQDRDELIGIGGDSTERGVDHHVFIPAYDLALDAGLRRTMHAGEDGPADNIAVSLDALHCERIDHGVRIVDDGALLARVADERIPLTMCPISNVLIAGIVPDVAGHPIADLRARGVLATVNADDPGMTATTIADDYEQVADAFGYGFEEMTAVALDGIEACWAPEDEKAALRARFTEEIATLR